MKRRTDAESDDVDPTGLGSLLEVYAELYPSMPERVRAIHAHGDPLVRSKLELLERLFRQRTDTRSNELMSRFGLTRSEARLAAWLSDGGTIAGYARINGVSAGTARTHLKAVFAKTGVHRQSQLTSLVLTRRRAAAD